MRAVQYFPAILAMLTGLTAGVRTTAAEPAGVEFPLGQDHVAVQLQRGGPSLLLAPVEINGHEAGMFLVDTGTSHLIVDRELVGGLGLDKMPSPARVGVLGGAQQQEMWMARSAAVGGVRCAGVPVTSTNLAQWKEMLGPKFAGLVGNDVLGRVPFTIDHAAATLTLHRPGKYQAAAGARLQRLISLSNTPAIRAQVEDEIDNWFLLDTGAENALSLMDWQNLRASWIKRKSWRLSFSLGLRGSAVSQEARADVVHLFGDQIPRLRLQRSENPAATRKAAGYFGMDLLRKYRLTIDFADGWLWAEPNPSPPAEWQRPDFDPKAADASGLNGLMRAAELGRAQEVRRFLEDPALDVNAQDRRGRSALFYAALNADPAVIKALLDRGADPNVTGKSEQITPLMQCAAGGSAAAVRMLLEAKAAADARDSYGISALYRAAEQDDPEIVRLLVKAGAKPNAASKAFGTPLMLACQMGNSRVVQALIEAGADVNYQHPADESTPLAWACTWDRETVVRLLVARGADVNGRAAHRQTPLHIAAASASEPAVRCLLEAGARRDLVDVSGKTPLQVASEGARFEIMRLLYVPPATQPATSTTNTSRP